MQNQLSLEILTETFDNLPIGVGIFKVLDLNDIKSIQYVFMNKVVLYEMRKDRENVFGKKIIDVAPEAYEHEGGLLVLETYRKVAAEGGSVNLGLVEYSNHMVAGIYECSVHHIKDNYVYVVLRNVTELERTKNELELKNNELSQLAYLVSHDLKGPLNTISSLVQLIKDKFQQQIDQEAEGLFIHISNVTKRMKRLITDLLDYSSIGQDKKITVVDCGKLIEEIQQDLASMIKETNTTFDVGILPEVQGFETELRMLFQNLIINAIKFRKPDISPTISIYAKEQDGWVFQIKDNGIGIDNKHKENIFRILHRLHSTNEYEGTGIGLAHCKKIVLMHKGEIWVDSELGEGSTFYFTIPFKF
jgi:light-regulated signal transduction histidine kinase (bacteriophytochrome)